MVKTPGLLRFLGSWGSSIVQRLFLNAAIRLQLSLQQADIVQITLQMRFAMAPFSPRYPSLQGYNSASLGSGETRMKRHPHLPGHRFCVVLHPTVPSHPIHMAG